MDTSKIYLKDIMTRDVVFVYPETPLTEAATILAERNFDGVPVVDHDDRLVGVLTEYDLLSKGFILHLPTLQFIFKNLSLFKQNPAQFTEVAEITSLKVKDVMNADPLTLNHSATYEETIVAFRDHHRVNPIPVIDENRKVVGVVSRFDVLKPFRELGI